MIDADSIPVKIVKCHSCTRWRSYESIYIDIKAHKVRKELNEGCELCTTSTICGENYEAKESPVA